MQFYNVQFAVCLGASLLLPVLPQSPPRLGGEPARGLQHSALTALNATVFRHPAHYYFWAQAQTFTGFVTDPFLVGFPT